MALRLENEWVILRRQYRSEGWPGPRGRNLREKLLRFDELLEPLFHGVARTLSTIRGVSNPNPPPPRLGRWCMLLCRSQIRLSKNVGVLDLELHGAVLPGTFEAGEESNELRMSGKLGRFEGMERVAPNRRSGSRTTVPPPALGPWSGGTVFQVFDLG